MESAYQADDHRYDGRMNYRRAGKSGILLPEIALGLWHHFGRYDDFDTCKKILHAAFDHGITHFDLANNYGPPNGSAEETFGKVMKSSFLPYRNELFLSTKAGHEMWPGPYGEWGSRKNLMNSLDASLKRMNVDYVDLFYSHRYDPVTPLEETMQTLVDVIGHQKALYAGISKYPAAVAESAFRYLKVRNVSCLAYQGRYNMLVREPEQDGILQLTKDYGVGFIAFSPLAQGLLTDKYIDGIIPETSRMAKGVFLKKEQLTDELLKKLRQLSALAADRGQSLAEMALSWLLKDEKVCSVIIGAGSVEQLKKNINAIRHAPFTEEELSMITSSPV